MDGWDRSDGLDSARPHGQAGQGPLDLWLKRELSKRYDATLDECLPETWLRLLTGTKGRR